MIFSTGQYRFDEEPNPEQHTLLVRFEPEILVQHTSQGTQTRRLGFRGSDGRLQYFAVASAYGTMMHSDERLVQLNVIMNRLLGKYKETRKRQLAFTVAPVIPLGNRMRLVDAPDDAVTFSEVWVFCCHVYFVMPMSNYFLFCLIDQVFECDFLLRGLDSEETLLIWRRELAAAGTLISNAQPPVIGTPAEIEAAKRRIVFDLMSREVVSDRILSAYFARSLLSTDQWLHFRRELAGQLALASFLSLIMSVGDRAPHKIQVNRSSGRVQQLEFCPTYTDDLFTTNSDTVPFRLTRNMTELIGPWLLDGVFAASMTGAAACFARNNEVIKNFFCLYMRDDVASFRATRLVCQSDIDAHRWELTLRDRISANVRQILKRAQNLMPTPQQASEAQRVCIQSFFRYVALFQVVFKKNQSRCVSSCSVSNTQEEPSPVNSKVLKLIEAAMDPALQANMPPSWHPWF